MFCHAPFEISSGQCRHEPDCIYERSCEIVGLKPLPLPEQVILDEWREESETSAFSE